MSIKIKIDEIVASNSTVVSSYIAADSALEIKFDCDLSAISLGERLNKSIGIRDRTILLIFGGLTLTFSGEVLGLTQIDAYTNNSKWVNANIALPSKVSSAKCSIQASTDDDRISFDCEPGYIFDGNEHRLLIKLSEEDGAIFYRLADNLIVGIAGEKIASLIVENVVIR